MDTVEPMKKEYTNGEITVVWQPEVCIHSKVCWHGLIKVFNPKERPWIRMDGANSEQIINQVKQCPSGALSYRTHSANATADEPQETLETRVEVLPNGPLLVYGTLRVKDRDGKEVVRSSTTAFCRCGQSATKPFCDGSHIKTHFQG